MAIVSVNPATGEALKSFTPLSDSQIDQKLERAAIAFSGFRARPFSERAQWMSNAAQILENEKENLGRLMTLEMGKPIRDAIEFSFLASDSLCCPGFDGRQRRASQACVECSAMRP